MARNSGALPLSAAARPAFDRLARSMRAQLAAAQSARATVARLD
jgi:hypothetical protein